MTRDELLSRLERMRDALRDRASDLTADAGSWREMSDRTGGATAAKLVKDALENEAQAAWLQEQADALGAIALSEARAALDGQGWQPIETLPSDWPHYKSFQVYTDRFNVLVVTSDKAGSYHYFGGSAWPLVEQPTHWRPNPAPPTEEN